MNFVLLVVVTMTVPVHLQSLVEYDVYQAKTTDSEKKKRNI